MPSRFAGLMLPPSPALLVEEAAGAPTKGNQAGVGTPHVQARTLAGTRQPTAARWKAHRRAEQRRMASLG